ncbi:MAG: outer membrane beta-barrel protein [Chitinophagaceae bacterium]
MQLIHWNKIVSTLFALVISIGVMSQQNTLNLEEHDNHKLYFGIQLGSNSSHYKFLLSDYYAQQDTIQTVESINRNGIHLGLLANWNVSERFDVRFYPLNLIFSDKKFQYTLLKPIQDGELADTKETKVESIVMSFPIQARLKSDRINNFRVYALAGFKYDFDLASNAGANVKLDLKAKKSDYGYEAGFGFQFYFKYFILSPEIKFSSGLRNVYVYDPASITSKVINEMKSRMIMLSIHFEGGGIF